MLDVSIIDRLIGIGCRFKLMPIIENHSAGIGRNFGQAVLTMQLNLDRSIIPVVINRVEAGQYPVFVFDNPLCGILNIYHGVRTVANCGINKFNLAVNQPTGKIEGVNRLINDHTAALFVPSPFPIAPRIVFICTFPCNRQFARDNPAQLARLQHCLHQFGTGVIPVLKDHAQDYTVLLGCTDHLISVSQRNGHRFFSQDMNALVGGINRHWGMQIVRRANVDNI